ncbi:AraC family transcriptional regulator [Agrobacterium sp. T29]|uniref:helix-turn-helix domain-containing protein n=1 Tax=Agrobacterium sp. T29 TaxID=2580515 RepID=UPI00115CC98A|nr:AraC family transcriptional regulator [Agrobacterium sp. T29]
MKTPLFDQHTAFKSGNCRTTSHRQKSWQGIQVDLVRRTGLEKEETAIISDRHLLLLNLQGSSERGDYFLDDRRTEFVPRKPGALLFVPAGCKWRGWEIGASSAAYLSICVTLPHVSQLFASQHSGKMSAFSPNLGFEDQVIMNAARGIGAEISDHNSLSGMLVEAYVATIFVQLMRKQKHVKPARNGGLASANLSRVTQKIDDELDQVVSLQQLADVAGLSVAHFCRAFKQTFGCPPYEFIVQRRIARSKEFLRGSAMSITEIALSCGFSSSSHFANVFRRNVGTTPAHYRSEWMNIAVH